jgi:hypothetical protein
MQRMTLVKATKALVEARTAELVRIVLDGALWPLDICEYVREKQAEVGSCWHVGEGEKLLSYSQIRRYAVKAEKIIGESTRIGRKRLLRRHLAQRRSLYAKAVSQGDIRAALACVDSEAKLLDLFPASKAEVSGKNGAAVQLHIVEEVVSGKPATLANVIEEVVSRDDTRPHDPPSSGTTSVPPQ